MWSEFLNQSRSQRKFQNKSLIILGNKHSGKRSLIDSLFDISKTNLNNKRLITPTDGNKMKLKGLTTAVDYAYLNVNDINDPDNRTHSKLQIYMIEQIDNPQIYSQLAQPHILCNSTIIIMLDFTTPWNFIVEIEKWVKFIYQLQKMAQLSIADLEQMASKLENYYKKFKEPQFDQNGKIKTHHNLDEQEDQLSLPLPDGVLTHNIRLPLMICLNKSDVQSQVLRDDSANKILVILYHLRSMCVKYGATLIYTSIRNNCNINLLYEYVLHRSYDMPLRFKPQPINQQAIFLPFGYDKPTLINDSVIKIDVEKSFNEYIPIPVVKKITKDQIIVEQDSKYFQKYINQNQQSTIASSSSNQTSEKEIEKPQQKKQAEVTDFFKNLLQGGTKRDTIGRTQEQTQKLLNAQRELMKHTTQVLQKKNLQE